MGTGLNGSVSPSPRARMETVTVVLVHGNPETDAVWDPLVEVLGRDDVVRLSPPGFGASLPTDFPATYLAYRDWLIDELDGIDEPVDLVGHDWGGCHVVNAVMHRPRTRAQLGQRHCRLVRHRLRMARHGPGVSDPRGRRAVGRDDAGRFGRGPVATAGHLRHARQTLRVRLRAAQGPQMGEAILRAVPIGAPTGSGRCRTGTGERRGPARTVDTGHRGPLRRLG